MGGLAAHHSKANKQARLVQLSQGSAWGARSPKVPCRAVLVAQEVEASALAGGGREASGQMGCGGQS